MERPENALEQALTRVYFDQCRSICGPFETPNRAIKHSQAP